MKLTKKNPMQKSLLKMFLWLSALMLASVGAVLAAPGGNDLLWRAQLEVRVADVTNAGTDDYVRVSLNDTNNSWLDYGQNDFERNSTFRYDLQLKDVNLINHIRFIKLTKTGTDGMFIRGISLFVNNRLIFNKNFAGSGFLLDNDGGGATQLMIGNNELVQHVSWLNYVQPAAPTAILRGELESRLEAFFGDFARNNPATKLQWGQKYGRAFVEVTAPNFLNKRVHVDLDMEAGVFGSNPEVDIDFDLQLTCNNGQLAFNVINKTVRIDSSWWAELFSFGVVQAIDVFNQREANNWLRAINQMIVSNQGTCNLNNWEVSVNADIAMLPTVPPVILLTAGTKTTAVALSVSEPADASAEMIEHPATFTQEIEAVDAQQNGAATVFAVRVTSTQSEPAPVKVQIELPQQVNVAEALVYVTDGNGTRTIAPQITAGENGLAVLSFDDVLMAGANNLYAIKLQPQTGATEKMEAHTTVTIAGAAAPLTSTSYLQLENSVLRVVGTVQATTQAATGAGEIKAQDRVNEIPETIKQ